MTGWALTRKRSRQVITASWECGNGSAWPADTWTSSASQAAVPVSWPDSPWSRLMTDPIRILIADDHLIIRQGLRLILETGEEFTLVGEAADGAEAVALCAELVPDVVLMDLRMPGMDG